MGVIRKGNILAEAQTYDDSYHRAAALLWHLISSHDFEDANKRTVWTVALEYLDRHGIDPGLPDDEVARVVRRHDPFTVDELREQVRKNLTAYLGGAPEDYNADTYHVDGPVADGGE